MTKEQALEVIKQACELIVANKQVHVKVEQALLILSESLNIK